MKKETTEEIKIQGTYYLGKEIRDMVKEIPIGTFLYLEREPENAYDTNAIKVIYKNILEEQFHIGYVSRPANEEIAEAMDLGKIYKVIYKGKYIEVY